MLKVAKDVNLSLWDAAGFFRLLDCWQNHEIDDYRNYNDSLTGTRYSFQEVNRKEEKPGVYILYFRLNGKFYVGSSKELTRRVSVHTGMLSSKKHYNGLLSRAYTNNSGLLPDVLFIFTYDEQQARDVEQRLIDLLFTDPHCLNQRQLVEEYRPATETTREKLTNAAKKQWQSEEFKKRIKEINQRPDNLAKRIANGKKNLENPEYMKKLSDASKKLWGNPEYAAGQKASGAAVWNEPGFRERHSAAMKAKWADPEYKAEVIRRSVETRKRNRDK